MKITQHVTQLTGFLFCVVSLSSTSLPNREAHNHQLIPTVLADRAPDRQENWTCSSQIELTTTYIHSHWSDPEQRPTNSNWLTARVHIAPSKPFTSPHNYGAGGNLNRNKLCVLQTTSFNKPYQGHVGRGDHLHGLTVAVEADVHHGRCSSRALAHTLGPRPRLLLLRRHRRRFCVGIAGSRKYGAPLARHWLAMGLGS